MRLPAAFRERTRKRPRTRLAAKTGLNRVVLYITNNPLLLGRIAHTAITIVSAPERSSSRQKPISRLGTAHLNAGYDSRNFDSSVEQQVNMIRHHDPTA